VTAPTLRAATATATVLAAHAAVNALLLRRAVTGAGARHATVPRQVSVLLPARNEAKRIAPCLRALLELDWPDLQILVLDDESEDGTADVVRRVAGSDARVKVLDGAPRPAGWLGKPWACAQLAGAAGGEILVFVDADVVVAPGAITALVDLVDRGLDLACPYPRQLADGMVARLVQPLLQWSWLTFLPLRLAERAEHPSLTAANGQLMACTAQSYTAVGGHTAVRADILEDIALARAYKRAGLRAGVADGTSLATCRMYTSAGEVVAGYTKSLWAAFGSPAGTFGAGALLAWLYLYPPAALAAAVWRGERRDAGVAAAGVAAGFAGRVVAALRTGGRPADAAAHPASVATLCWLMIASVRGRRRGTLTWRGRPVVRNDDVTATWSPVPRQRGAPSAKKQRT
jgi:hypothetical protein